MQIKRFAPISVACLVLCAAVGIGSARHRGGTTFQEPQEEPVYDSNLSKPNVLANPHVADTVARLEKVYQHLKARNFPDFRNAELTRDLLILPDQANSEVNEYQKMWASPITMPTDPRASEVALYTDLYVRSGIKAYKGDISVPHPEGFYLVVWKDGSVEKVDVTDVRCLSTGSNGEYIEVFPGMASYDPALPKTLLVRGAEAAGVRLK